MSCSACFSGTVHEHETPTGTVKKIHGRDTYIAEPPNGIQPKGIVIIISDAFGWEFVNNRALADRYAKKGDFLVYLPDFMDGKLFSIWILLQ